ncbi:hypothetical protein V8D89_003643 [Ganoderma adspersum]
MHGGTLDPDDLQWRSHCGTGAKTAVDLGYSPQELAPHGFPGPQAFANVVSDFIDSHLWAWLAIAKILVSRRGGIAWSQTPPKFLTFNLAPTPMLSRPRAERNPATTFVLDSYEFSDLNAFHAAVPSAAKDWAEREDARRHVEQSHRSNKLYAGLLPVEYKVTTFNIMSMSQYMPQFKPPFVPPPEHAEFIYKNIMSNVFDVCVASINLGFPLRAADPDNPSLVLPGQFTRDQDTSWTWHPLYTDWQEYQTGGHEGYDAAMEKIDPEIPPQDLMKVFLVF